ncbi:MAG TPA: hypothetical protein VMT59_05750 [Gaiellaceae bacterium]|nr:hypothetical protein [Gaiellaceae bacterium]
MTDDEFLAGVERAASGAPPHGFHFGHREHLRLAWLQHDRLGPEAGDEATAATLRRIDAAHGGGKYHETITRFWLGLVRHARGRFAGAGFEAVLAAHPQLLDDETLSRHYSRELLATAEARRSVLAPDLEPVPWEPGAV